MGARERESQSCRRLNGSTTHILILLRGLSLDSRSLRIKLRYGRWFCCEEGPTPYHRESWYQSDDDDGSGNSYFG